MTDTKNDATHGYCNTCGKDMGELPEGWNQHPADTICQDCCRKPADTKPQDWPDMPRPSDERLEFPPSPKCGFRMRLHYSSQLGFQIEFRGEGGGWHTLAGGLPAWLMDIFAARFCACAFEDERVDILAEYDEYLCDDTAEDAQIAADLDLRLSENALQHYKCRAWEREQAKGENDGE